MSTNTERITNLETEVELLKQKLNDSINFINTLRVMYEMKHPVEEEPKTISLASTIVDEVEEEPKTISLASTIVDEVEEEPKTISLASTIVDEVEEEPKTISLASTIVDEVEEEPKTISLSSTIDPFENDEEKPKTISLASTIVEEDLIEQKFEKMNKTYDDLELLSDNEEYDEECELIECENKEEEVVIESSIVPPPPTPPTPVLQNIEAPLPPNLSTSPLPEFSEEPEEIVKEVIDYKKTNVGELKKLCKSRGFKGYSKLKKNQLIELLTQ